MSHLSTRVERFPPAPPPLEPTVRRLAALRDRRRAGAGLAIVMAVLLPFAIVDHVAQRVSIGAALAGAALLAVWSHVVLEAKLSALSVHPQFAELPDLARRREQLVSARRRRALAMDLRHLASITIAGRRRQVGIPLLRERVVEVRPQLLEIAAALERTDAPRPAAVALVQELMRDGTSPLYNPHVPTFTLYATLQSVRAGLPDDPSHS